MKQPSRLNRPLRGPCAKSVRSLVTSVSVIMAVMHPLTFIFLLLELPWGERLVGNKWVM